MSSNIRPVSAVAGATRYSVPRPSAPVDLRLDGNEGIAPPAELLQALAEIGPEVLRCYPDAKPLEMALAERYGVTADRVIVTAGADEALDRIARSVLGPGRELILPVPTFEMIERYARLAGADVVHVPWGDDPFPVEQILAARTERTAAVAVVTPNNPTGASVSREQLMRLAEAMPDVLLIVDAAYGEFAEDDITGLALTLENAVVTRTFSKAWGLAGLRVGYALGPAEIIGWLRVAGGPYSVARPALAVAHRRLETGEADMQQFLETVRDQAKRLTARLEGWGVKVASSEANFILVQLENAAWVHQALGGLGIAVRAFPGRAGLDDRLRITLPGTEEGFQRLESALRTIFEPQAILFDVDGILADVSRSYRMAIEKTGEGFGVTISPEDVAAAKREGNANDDWELTHRLLADKGKDVPFPDVVERFEAFYQGTPEQPGLKESESLIPDRAWLEALSRRVPLAVVTGRPSGDLNDFFERTGVRDCFRVTVCREETRLGKPDPEPVALALERLGVERAWMIGDMPDDVRSARGASVLPLAVVPPGDDAAHGDALLRAGAATILNRVEDVEGLWP
ncbi:MAG: aminotransferase class I/II-fold pyridoxal phosphate-dependent enzyme [Planctomycetota bacterium]